MRLAVLASHPIQYQAPLFRALARRLDLHVFFAHEATPQEQANAGFGAPFVWDVDLISGYANSFLDNVARRPGASEFFGCDTPDIGDHLRQGRFDALMVTGWGLKSYLQGIYAAKRLRLPVMARGDSHLLTPRSRPKAAAKAALYPPFLRLFDAALYVGQLSRAYYEHYGFPASRLYFSPHCIDAAWFAPRADARARDETRKHLAIGPNAFVLLLAGKLIALKRPLDLIRAAAACHARGGNVEVLVAGDGELAPLLVEAAGRTGVPLHMLGFRNQADMPAAYAAADCLTLPSASETWGLVANEALACNRPIIVSDQCGCAPDLACDGIAGRTFRVGDIADFRAAIESVAADRDRGEAIANLSHKYSVARAVDGIEAAAEFCIGARAGRKRLAMES